MNVNFRPMETLAAFHERFRPIACFTGRPLHNDMNSEVPRALRSIFEDDSSNSGHVLPCGSIYTVSGFIAHLLYDLPCSAHVRLLGNLIYKKKNEELVAMAKKYYLEYEEMRKPYIQKIEKFVKALYHGEWDTPKRPTLNDHN